MEFPVCINSYWLRKRAFYRFMKIRKAYHYYWIGFFSNGNIFKPYASQKIENDLVRSQTKVKKISLSIMLTIVILKRFFLTL